MACFCPAPLAADEVDYGLYFRSHDVNQDNRTSLNLSPESHFRLKHGFRLSFDVRFYELSASYGYVFRIISGSDSSLDMVSNIRSKRLNFILSHQRRVVENISLDSLDVGAGEWCHVEVDVSSKGEVTCFLEGMPCHLEKALDGLGDIDIRFGLNDHPLYYTTDVAPMSVKDISLESYGGMNWYWQLLRHNETEVYDLNHERRASVGNGEWIIDGHSEWTAIRSMKTASGVPMIAYDDETSRVFIATEDSLHVWNMDSGITVSEKVLSGTPIRGSGNQMVYDRASDRLVCYSMHDSRIAVYDFDSRRWTGSFHETWPPMTGHSHVYDRDSSCIYVFGGYGNHQYKADLIKMDMKTGSRTVSDVSDDVWPRYFSAMGFDPEGNVLIMGGFGNSSGYQEESPTNLTDIVRIDRNTGAGSVVGRFAPGNEPYGFGSSLLCDEGRIYSLVFNNTKFKTGLSLASYDFGQNSPLVLYGNPIEYHFRDVDAWSGLVFNSDSTRLYSIVLSSARRGVNEVGVYSLSYPPMLASEIVQTPPKKFPYYILIIVVGLLLCGAIVVMSIYIRQLRHFRRMLLEDKEIPFSISLLGGFHIHDASGTDITSRLTSLPRQILLYFILRMMSRKSSITSSEIDDKFWYGMDRAQITNNRNVNIRKLRLVLKDVGNVKLTYNNDIWTLDMGDGVSCDYCVILPLLKRINKSDKVRAEDIVTILSIARKGALLPGYEYEWLDKYKAAYSDLLVSALIKISNHPLVSDEPDLKLKVADCIMLEDCIDEFAIRLKCKTLYETGHKGKSKQVYDQYVLDYKRLLDSEPEVSYKEMLR